MVDGIVPTRVLELRSMRVSSEESPMSEGMGPVRLASEMTSLWREWKEERLEGKGRWRGIEMMLISVTKPWDEQEMKDQLQGDDESRTFQLEKRGETGELEEWSHEKRSEASWLEEEEEEEEWGKRMRKEREKKRNWMDICLKFQTSVLGFA